MSSHARHLPLKPMMAGTFEHGLFVPEGTLRRRARIHSLAAWAVVLLALAAIAAILVFHQQGGNWFVVDTPSMGTAAPVGTLVLTDKADAASLRVGQTITFHPPTSPAEVYTHRIVAISATRGISTRGDINGATDPWSLRPSDVIGRTVAMVHGVGWLVRAIPILIAGFLVVFALSLTIRSASVRAASRVLGVTLVFSLASYLLRPFAGMVVLASNVENAAAHATIVSTGILPIRVWQEAGNEVRLRDGEVGSLQAPIAATGAKYHFLSALNLSPIEWVIVGGFCLLPLLWCLIIGFPRADDDTLE